MILGRGQDIVAYEGRRSGKDWEAFREEHQGELILTASQHEAADAVARAVLTDGVAGPIVRSMTSVEHVVTWADQATGIACKAMVDGSSSTVLLDLKTAKDASPAAFGRAAHAYDYVGQLAWYRRGYRAHYGHDPSEVVLIVAEKVSPYVVAVYRLGDLDLLAADRRADALLDRVAQCQADDRWPGYGEGYGVMDLVLPPWAMAGEGEFGAGSAATEGDDA
jgi:hypothetical protein